MEAGPKTIIRIIFWAFVIIVAGAIVYQALRLAFKGLTDTIMLFIIIIAVGALYGNRRKVREYFLPEE